MQKASNLSRGRGRSKAQQPAVRFRQGAKKTNNSLRKTSKLVYSLDGELFGEMLVQIRMLMGVKGGCSELELRGQFQNLSADLVQDFIAATIRRGIMKEDPRGTFTLT